MTIDHGQPTDGQLTSAKLYSTWPYITGCQPAEKVINFYSLKRGSQNWQCRLKLTEQEVKVI